MSDFDVIVIGGGQAGLGIGYYLQQAGHRFVILERGRVGETWRSQRWDSFAVNTPNWSNGLPGDPYDGDQPDGFYHRDELVASFERYVAKFDLPVRSGTTVTAVDREDGEAFLVTATDAAGSSDALITRNVVVASGILQTPKIPAVADRFSDTVTQLHAANYRNAGALPDGGVVVIGGGQSGCQIAADLLGSGRTVYLCTSRVGRLPRRYRGRDILDWWVDTGMWNMTVDDLPDAAMQFAAQPQVSGVGRYGSTLSLQYLAGQGLRLLGRLSDVTDGILVTDDRLDEYLAFADDRSAHFKADIDHYIATVGLEAPPPEDDPIDAPADPGVADVASTELDLVGAGVSTVIWCTGFTASFDWLHLPVLDDDGRPRHERGVADVGGIYFLGFPWLHTRKSGVIYGIEEDAGHIAAAIDTRLGALVD
jgi:putative flavoprotein involved in K+ transport